MARPPVRKYIAPSLPISASVKASGDSVTITTTKPYGWFLNRVGAFTNSIPPRELIA